MAQVLAQVLAQAADLKVTVTSQPGGPALTNATVVAEWDPTGRLAAGPGPAPLRLALPPEAAGLRLTVSAPGHTPLQSRPADGVAEVLVALPPAQILGGTVADDAGQPVGGVEVFLNFPRKLAGPRVPIESLPVVTDASGRWQADWVPANASQVRVQFRHPDFETAEAPAFLMEELRNRSARMVLHPLARVEGVVLSPDGNPVPEADVFYGEEFMLWGIEENRKTRTDASGRFRFAGLPMKRTAFAAYTAALAPVALVVDLKPDSAPITLQLERPRTLAARVVDQDGRGMEGVSVRWDEAGLLRYPGWTGQTDATGRFQITNCIAGEITVDLTKGGFLRMSARLTPGAEEQTLVLPPVVRFAGTVVEAASGRPVKSFKLIPGLFRGGIPGAPERFFGNEYDSRSFADGAFSLVVEAPAIMQVPPPIRHGLRIVAEGFQPETLGPFDSTNETLVARLKPLEKRTVRILQPDGRPAAGAELQLAENAHSFQTTNGSFAPKAAWSGRPIFAGTADARGELVLDEALEPRFGLAIHDSGFQWLSPASSLAEPVTLTPWGSVSGTLSRHGKPLAREPVALLPAFLPIPSGTNVVWYPHPLANQRAVTDEAGRFQFDRVPPGNAGLALVEPEAAVPGMGRPVGQPRHAATVGVVSVQAGARTPLELHLTGTDVSGVLVLPPDAPPNYDWNYAQLYLTRMLPEIAAPPGLDDAARARWFLDWFHSEAAAPLRPWISFRTALGARGRLFPEGRSVPVQPGGLFRFRALPPGDYNVRSVLQVRGKNLEPQLWENLSLRFTVPDDAGEEWSLGRIGWTNSLADVTTPAPTDREPVTAGLALADPTPAPGSLVVLRLRVRVAPGHHIYAPEEPAKTYTPLTLKLTLPEGWEEFGEWNEPAAAHKDGHSILAGDLMFRRLLVVPRNATGAAPLSCDLKVQACNADFCWPPRTVTTTALVSFPPATHSSKSP